MEHDVRIDGIVPRVTAHGGRDGTAHVTLLVQDVVELQADGCGASFEERLGYLGIPKKFVFMEASE